MMIDESKSQARRRKRRNKQSKQANKANALPFDLYPSMGQELARGNGNDVGAVGALFGESEARNDPCMPCPATEALVLATSMPLEGVGCCLGMLWWWRWSERQGKACKWVSASSRSVRTHHLFCCSNKKMTRRRMGGRAHLEQEHSLTLLTL